MYAKKSLGQHFLRCGWVIQTLIEAAGLTQEDSVLEIGPGTGVLTRELASRAGKVIAIEKDEMLADTLAAALEKRGAGNVEIIKGDILRLPQTRFRPVRDPNGPNLVWAKHPKYKVVANIPYYLTSRLLRLLLEQDPRPERMVLTLQKEVALRIAAQPPRMNILALSVQAFGTAKIIKTVPADCFSPKPDVDSAVILISEISYRFFQKNQIAPTHFFRLIRLGFSQKRKQLLNTLGGNKGIADKKTVTEALIGLELNPQARPEELSLQNWAELAKELP